MPRARKSSSAAAVAVRSVAPAPPKMKKRKFELDGGIIIVVTAPEGALDWDANQTSASFATRGSSQRVARPTHEPTIAQQSSGSAEYTNNLGENENPKLGTLADLPPGAAIPSMDGGDPFLQRIAGIRAGIIAGATSEITHEAESGSAPGAEN